MKKTFGATHILILVSLLTLILVPRPIAGTLELRSAGRFYATGEYPQAAAAYISAAERIPWMPSLWEKAGNAFLNEKDYSTAEYYYRLAFERNALSSNGLMNWGDIAFGLGDARKAINLWDGLIAGGGDPSVLLPRIAQAYQALEDYPDGIQTWQKYLLVQPGDAAAHYRLGLLQAATVPGEALPELMQAARLDPGLDPTVQGLRTALNTALVSGERASQFVVAGRALGELGEWTLADEAFRTATTERAEDGEAWAWLGEAEQQLGRDGGAEIERALALDPGSAMVQGLDGLYLQRQGQPQTAMAAFQEAARLAPDDPGWQIALGSATEQTGDLVTAYEYYFRAVELAPGEAATWRALVAFSVGNDVDVDTTGLPAARKLIEMAPNDWHSFDLAGQAEFLQEDYAAAMVYLKKAVQLGPTQAAPALHLAMVYMQSGDQASAHSYLILAQAFDPIGPSGWQAGRLLEQYFP